MVLSVRWNHLPELLREIKNKVRLKDYISEDIELIQRGSRWIGLCPFHEDRSPSFAVFPPKDGVAARWGCHPCNRKGDLADYVQQRQQCSLIEAIEHIIDRTGFDASAYLREGTESEVLRDAQFQYMKGMATFFHENLMASPPQLYFLREERGLTDETIKRFLIGYCPSVDFAREYFTNEGLAFLEPEIGNWENIFGGHLLLPQFTPMGQVCGFYARHAEGKPKYVSTSSKSPLYDANARLYGLFQSQKIPDRKKSEILIVEGFFDAMIAQQNGFAAIATCGTSLVDNQIEALKAKAIREVVLIYDGDEAGRRAMLDLAYRAHNINGLNCKFGFVVGDPDEFINERGAHAFSVVIEEALCAVEFVITNYAHAGLVSTTEKNDFFRHCLSYLATLPRRSFSRILGVDTVARMLEIDRGAIEIDLDRLCEPPHSSSIAECVVLAEFCYNSEAFSTFSALRSSHFTYHAHETLFALMSTLYGAGAAINPDLLYHEISRKRLGTQYVDLVASLAQKDRSNVDRYISELIDTSTRLGIGGLFSRAQGDIYDLKSAVSETVASTIETASKLLLGNKVRQVVFSGPEIAQEARGIFETNRSSHEPIVGLDLGPAWAHLMNWTKGLRGGRVYIIAALSNVGKSIVLANWTYGIAIRPDGPLASGLFVSMEMGRNENFVRFWSIDSGLPYDVINCGRVENETQLAHLQESWERIKSANITWMMGQKTISEIAIQARMLKAQGKLDFISIDYIQLLNLNGYANHLSQYDRYAIASQEIKDLAEVLDVPILIAAQLNRKGYEQAEPSGEHIGSCYKIYQDAHVCYILAEREKGILGILDKNRDGPKRQSTKLCCSFEPGRANLRIWEGE